MVVMEVPQVTIKQEQVDNFTLNTEPHVYYETPVLDLPDIKPEFVKVEPFSDVYEPTHLDEDLRVSEETQMILNNDENMLDCSKMAENDNIADKGQCQISNILQQLNLKNLGFPTYLKKLLIYTGFDTIASLAQFKENEDFDAIQNFAAFKLPKLIAESEKQSFYGIYARRVEEFQIPLGHRKLLNILLEYCKIYFKEQFPTKNGNLNDNTKRKELSSSDNPMKKIKTINQNLLTAKYTQPQPGSSNSDGGEKTDNQNVEENAKIIEHIKSLSTNYVKSFLHKVDDAGKKSSAMLNLSKLSVEFQNGTALVHCPECEFVSRTFTHVINGRKKWTLSNFNKHYRTHFNAKKSWIYKKQ